MRCEALDSRTGLRFLAGWVKHLTSHEWPFNMTHSSHSGRIIADRVGQASGEQRANI